MMFLDKMAESRIPINWGTVLVGWTGPGKYSRLLSIADIASYARDLIEANPDQPREVLKLAGAGDDETESVNACLRALSGGAGVDVELETRKWRLILLKDFIKALGDDPLYGLLGLTEFWERFDYPLDGPHVVQGRGNSQAPQDYYTEDNYRRIVERHRQWIDKEEALLKA